MADVFVGKLVLTDCGSEIGPAVIVVQDGIIKEVHRGTNDVSIVQGPIIKVIVGKLMEHFNAY